MRKIRPTINEAYIRVGRLRNTFLDAILVVLCQNCIFSSAYVSACYCSASACVPGLVSAPVLTIVPSHIPLPSAMSALWGAPHLHFWQATGGNVNFVGGWYKLLHIIRINNLQHMGPEPRLLGEERCDDLLCMCVHLCVN
jgi:hypothetical protein